MKYALSLALTALMASCLVCSANNLSITNVSFENITNGALDIEFDVSWDHSWRASWSDNGDSVTVTNWDAVWLFCKYRVSGQQWKHVMLAPSGHTATVSTQIDVPVDDSGLSLGAFLHRNSEGSGTMTCNDVRLRWNYVESGLSGTNEVDIQVMGHEMVYIPEGAFYLGSGGTELYPFYEYPDVLQPYLVTTEGEIEVGPVNSNLCAYGLSTFTLAANWPKGYAPFYCMKYEMTEGAFVDFLNLLDPAVAEAYIQTNRYGIDGFSIRRSGGAYVSDAPDCAKSYNAANAIYAYLDWCGLRAMTELEYEKVCRGVRTPWVNEYVWGNTTLVGLTNISGVYGSGTETKQPANANCQYTPTFKKTLRAGIFADASTTREEAGAGYYGVLDLAGGLREFTIDIARTDSRAYTGEYGDGEISTVPPYTVGYGTLRGGSLNDPSYPVRLKTSDRSFYAVNVSSYGDTGFRGVRDEP